MYHMKPEELKEVINGAFKRYGYNIKIQLTMDDGEKKEFYPEYTEHTIIRNVLFLRKRAFDTFLEINAIQSVDIIKDDRNEGR